MPLHVSIVSVKNYKYIRVYSSYRNEKGQPRSRLIENHGRLMLHCSRILNTLRN